MKVQAAALCGGVSTWRGTPECLSVRQLYGSALHVSLAMRYTLSHKTSQFMVFIVYRMPSIGL